MAEAKLPRVSRRTRSCCAGDANAEVSGRTGLEGCSRGSQLAVNLGSFAAIWGFSRAGGAVW
jgi:hypothetical protein